MRRVSKSSVSPRGLIAWAERRSNEPAKIESAVNSSCSSCSSMSYDQLMASSIVRCRGSLPRRIAFSSPKRSSRRWAISATPIARARAAASSIASGMPSRRRQISTTTGSRRVVEHEVRIGRARPRHEERNRGNRHRLVARDLVRPRPSTVVRPTTPARRQPPVVRGSSRRSTLTAPRSGSGSPAPRPASTRCSQLSSSKRLWRGRSISAIASSIELPRRTFTSIAVANAADVASSSTTLTSSTTWTPSE